MIRPADGAGFEMDQLQLYVVWFKCISVTFSWELQHPPLSSAINQVWTSIIREKRTTPRFRLVIQLRWGQRTLWDSSIDQLLTIERENQKEEIYRINPHIWTVNTPLFYYFYINIYWCCFSLLGKCYWHWDIIYQSSIVYKRFIKNNLKV